MQSSDDAGAPTLPAWRVALDPEAQAADHYPDQYNASLLAMVEQAPARVLELGCATGLLGAKLKERFPNAFVAGIEANRAAADLAARRLDHVERARLEDVRFSAQEPRGGPFDLVIAGDVLEHLVDPWRLLERLKPCLAPGATLLASIPNVRNLALLSDVLLKGSWEYQASGLLDVTHLRFFTFADMRRMFEQTGYTVESSSFTLSGPMAKLWQDRREAPSTTVRLGRLTLENVSPAELAELCAQHFLLRCRAA